MRQLRRTRAASSPGSDGENTSGVAARRPASRSHRVNRDGHTMESRRAYRVTGDGAGVGESNVGGVTGYCFSLSKRYLTDCGGAAVGNPH